MPNPSVNTGQAPGRRGSRPCVVLVTRFTPSAVGHGGKHRTYQIVHDVCESIGTDRLHVLSLSDWKKPPRGTPRSSSLQTLKLDLQQQIQSFLENPWRLWHRTRYAAHGRLPPAMVAHYRQLLAEIGKPALVILGHSGFTDILDINAAQGIPTVACVENLESLDTGEALTGQRRQTAARMGDLAVEADRLARCRDRLFISKVEAGLIGGMGLDAQYYPYLPVGEIRASLQQVRQRRATTLQEPGLFLMVGSAGHQTTAEAFAWFIRHAQQQGLPPRVRVVVGGARTDKLLPPGVTVPGLECRGFLPQAEMEELLATAQAVLVPQFRGFGALTRLPEMACAGIPVCVSPHPTFALNVPPGVQVVENSWEAWSAVLASPMGAEAPAGAEWDAYVAWEQQQPRSLGPLLGKYGARETRPGATDTESMLRPRG